MTAYRVGNHQPQNLYRGDTYIGVMFNPIDAAAVARHLNMGLGECTCASYEPCNGECCGVGMCTCSAPAGTCTDEWQRPHQAGSRPNMCATCSQLHPVAGTEEG